MRKHLLPCLALCMLVALAQRAEAHAFLEHASPPVGGTVSAPPKEIRLQFSEAIEPAFSDIKLATKAGDAVEIGPVSIDPNDSTQLVAAVPTRWRRARTR
jgi:copper resistance protein C